MNIETVTAVQPVKFPLGTPRLFPEDEAMRKMWRNAKKAIEEHVKKIPPPNPYEALSEALPSLEDLKKAHDLPPLTFSFDQASAIGRRSTMQDAHFFKEIESGILTGVFDGHGLMGERVSKYANDEFKARFEAKLKEVQGNYFQAFEILVHEIHDEVVNKKELHMGGTTAVICAINKATHLIYTATLGDSEANIYRSTSSTKSIPLSCVRDWSCPKDAKRAEDCLNGRGLAELFRKSQPKLIRVPHPSSGINISRAIGDKDLLEINEKPCLIHKPKISVNRVKPGDRVVLVCDGVKDFYPECRIVEDIQKATADEIVRAAIGRFVSEDNVSVVIIDVK